MASTPGRKGRKSRNKKTIIHQDNTSSRKSQFFLIPLESVQTGAGPEAYKENEKKWEINPRLKKSDRISEVGR